MSIVTKNKKRYNGGGGYGSWGNLPGQSKSHLNHLIDNPELNNQIKEAAILQVVGD